MWRLASIFVALLLLAMFVWPSEAADDPKDCGFAGARSGLTGQEKFEICTRLIESKKYQGDDLWQFYYFRSIFQNDDDKKIADLDVALKMALVTRNAGYKLFVAQIYYLRAVAWSNKREFDRAVADYTEAIRIESSYWFFSSRGMAWLGKGDLDQAMADFNESIRRSTDPNANGLAHGGRCEVWLRKDDLKRAISECEEAVRKFNTWPAHYTLRGRVHEKLGNIALAKADYEKAISLENKGYGLKANDEARERLAALTRSTEQAAPPPPPPATQQSDADVRRDYELAAKIATKEALEAFLARHGSGYYADLARAQLATLAAVTPNAPVQAGPSAKPTADPGRRVALVIGNSAYKGVSMLPNPRRDADVLATALRGVGFDTVTVENDLTREKLINALRIFAREAEKSDWAMVYFTGHGIEGNGVNYLLPIDAKLEIDRDVEFEGVTLAQVLNAVDGAKKIRVVLLDACRDNPVAKQMRRTGVSRSIGRGLARVEPDAGTLVVYSAKHGEIALDGDGANRPFVAALVKHLPTPGVEIGKLFHLVSDDVVEATKRRQEPFTYGRLSGREDFYFVSK